MPAFWGWLYQRHLSEVLFSSYPMYKYFIKDQLFKSWLAWPWVNLKFKETFSNSLFVNLKIFLQALCLDL